MIPEIKIFALASLGNGISGGDRIYIEFARRWSKKTKVSVYLWSEGYQMCTRQQLDKTKVAFFVSKMNPWCKMGFIICYLARILEGIRIGLVTKLSDDVNSPVIIYSASEFWMDSLPALIMKLRYKDKCKWIAAWYQTAPNPFKGFLESGFRENRYLAKSFMYWLMQFPIKPLITNFADIVVVNNESERGRFPRLNEKKRVVVVLGAVPLENIKKYKSSISQSTKKIYDAVFQGRFHPQKGVVELVDIWKRVVEKRSGSKLAMIGDGPLMGKVKERVIKYNLQNNIKLFGYVYDGPQKYKIFSQSKLVVHPAFYDSGGMASAEAMAFGLPCVGFNLKSYESYYPHGMIKVKVGDLGSFSDTILKLLNNNDLRKEVGKEAQKMIEKYWSWDNRANQVFSKII